MDYTKVLLKHYEGLGWSCGDTYESLVWNSKTTEKPTQEELNLKRNDLLKEEMRIERNQLLRDSDFVMLHDIPLTEEKKNEWIQYRAELRNFPVIWTEGMPFPIPPE